MLWNAQILRTRPNWFICFQRIGYVQSSPFQNWFILALEPLMINLRFSFYSLVLRFIYDFLFNSSFKSLVLVNFVKSWWNCSVTGDPDELVSAAGRSIDSNLENWRDLSKLSLLNLTYDVTPGDLVTAVITELAVLPCTSVPVVLRVKHAVW